jgi:hypothetical protein
MSEEGSREGFLSRWSRRKRAVREGEAPEEPVAAPPAARPASPAPVAEDAPPPDLSLLPKIEDLTADSDLSPFFAKGVPLALRQAALSRIWVLDPAIRDFVGPADYAWDFNAPDGVPGFGFELPEEAKALAKRLLGVDREEQERQVQQASEAMARPEAAPPAEAPASAPPALAASPPDVLPPMLPPAAGPDAAAEAAADPSSAQQAAPPPRRRHGSALPC